MLRKAQRFAKTVPSSSEEMLYSLRPGSVDIFLQCSKRKPGVSLPPLCSRKTRGATNIDQLVPCLRNRSCLKSFFSQCVVIQSLSQSQCYIWSSGLWSHSPLAASCSVLQHLAASCSILQHLAASCSESSKRSMKRSPVFQSGRVLFLALPGRKSQV